MSLDAQRARNRHLAWCRARNLRPSTIYSRTRSLARLALAVGNPLEVDSDTMERWYDGLTTRMLPESRAVELSHVRAYYRWAVMDGLLESDPTIYLTRPRLPARLPNPMPQDDVELALSSAPGRIRPWVHLAAYAGLRCYEIAALRGDALRFTGVDDIILLGDTKGGGMESVSAPPVLVEALASLPRRGWLFPRRDGQAGHITANLVSQLGNRYLHSVGIDHTMHSLRHWYGTNFYRVSGHNMIQTQQAMRHKAPSSTMGYVWVDPAERSDIARLLPGANGTRATDGPQQATG